jgi:hypothetical protein
MALLSFRGFDTPSLSAQGEQRRSFLVQHRPGHSLADHINIIDKERELYRNILKDHTALTNADFEALKLLDQPLVWDASFAKEKGIIQEIGIPALPQGTPIFNVDY